MRAHVVTAALLMLVLGLSSQAAAQKVHTDFDVSANFSKYRTFFWPKGNITPNPLADERIKADFNAQLQAKGWQLVDDVNAADVALVVNVATREQKSLNTFYTGGMGGWGYGGWGMGMGSATTTVNTYTEGTLVADMFDAKTKKLLWRGTASDTISDNPQKNAKKIKKVAEKLFKKFPPTAKT